MLLFTTFFIVASLSLHSFAYPLADKSLVKRGAGLSGLSEREASTQYLLENNLWGEAAGTGKQTSKMTSSSGTTVAWHTDYIWSGSPTMVKSYANMDLQVGLKKQICSIESIPSTWDWTYSSASSDLAADVSYDIWLSTQSDGTGASSTSSIEIMVWLSARGGAEPAGSQVGNATFNGLTWQLYKGTVSTWTTYSYVAPSELTGFSQDLLPFITHLTTNYGISTSQYLVQVQAGTEPFVGTARLTTLGYTTTVNSGATCGGSTVTIESTNPTTNTAPTVAAASGYGQCGGSAWTGPTTCVSPYVCTYSNPYYSQCIPGPLYRI